MNSTFIKSRHISLTYQKKAGTKTSFNLTEGQSNILPFRLSFMSYSGKDSLRKAHYEINGTYKLNEYGMYYSMNKRVVHTKVMPIKDNPSFIGWGEIDSRFNIYDLVIIYSADNCTESFQIHLFKGMAKPEYFQPICEYLQAFINNKSLKHGLVLG